MLAKKRKPPVDDKVPSASTKKQKILPDTLAIPPDGNSIKWVISWSMSVILTSSTGAFACGTGTNNNPGVKEVTPLPLA